MREMKEQEYKIENIRSFELVDIFECGQCFRWNKKSDGSYTGVFNGNVMNVQKVGETITFKKLPPFMLEILEQGGLIEYLKNKK